LKANRKNKRSKKNKGSDLLKLLSGHDNFIYNVLCSDIPEGLISITKKSEKELLNKKISVNKRKG